jgi:hypothetical protein
MIDPWIALMLWALGGLAIGLVVYFIPISK